MESLDSRKRYATHKMNNRLKTIIVALLAILIALLALSTSVFATAIGYFFLLIAGYALVGGLVARIYMKLRNRHAAHPYRMGIIVSGILGVSTVIIVSRIIAGGESATGLLFASPFFVAASLIAGVVIGRYLSNRSEKRA